MKKTKIICTMDPDTSDKNTMMELARDGMDVARPDSPHGDYNEHQGHLELLREVRRELDIPIAVLFDTKGPEIRTGQLKDGKKATLKEGQAYTLTTGELTGGDAVGYIDYNGLNGNVAAGNRILVDDGLIELEVREVRDTDIVCGIINGGELGEGRGVSVPNVKIRLPVLTDKDKENIHFRIRQGFGSIVASLACTAGCMKEIRAMLDEQGSDMKVIAKTENTEGVENLDAIIEAADGIMVARGDTGVGIPTEKVLHIQRKTIRKCNETCEIVTTTTQVLDPTIRNPRPTRTEVTDVASAVYDSTDAVMLSGGTAVGKYPADTLKVMVSTTLETKGYLDYARYRQRKVAEQNMKNVSNAVCFVSMPIAHSLGADMIIAPSITGFTTQMLSKWRPGARIIGVFPSMVTVRQIQLQWGVVPIWPHRAESMGELIENSVEGLKDRGFVERGELAVITAGVVTYTGRHEVTTQTNVTRVTNIE